MRLDHRLLLLPLLLAGCAAPKPVASPTPDRVTMLMQEADKAPDNEARAVALRAAVDLMPPGERRDQAKKECIAAMVEAGGNAESYRLWSDLLAKKPENAKEAGRMAERARKLMVQQGEELTAQAALDLQEKHPQAAECTAQAALDLFKLSGETGKNPQAAQLALERARKPAP